MDLAALLVDVVALAKDAVGGTGGVMVDVTHRQLGARTVTGVTTTSTTRSALWERKQTRFRMADGTEKVATGKLTLLETVTVRATDTFVLPDGSVGVVIDTGGLDTPQGQPYAEVWLGFSAERGERG